MQRVNELMIIWSDIHHFSDDWNQETLQQFPDRYLWQKVRQSPVKFVVIKIIFKAKHDVFLTLTKWKLNMYLSVADTHFVNINSGDLVGQEEGEIFYN